MLVSAGTGHPVVVQLDLGSGLSAPVLLTPGQLLQDGTLENIQLLLRSAQSLLLVSDL